MMYKARAKGQVLGRLWGGGKGFYPTIQLSASSDTLKACLKDIETQAIIGLKIGSLDSGMGFESLIGAVLAMEITAYKTDDDGREWTSYVPTENVVVGELSLDEFDFTTDLLNS